MESGREETLKTLHAAAMRIQACDTVEAACERTVAAARDVLELEMCSVLLHEDGWLEPLAVSSGAPADGVRRLRATQGLAGRTFQSGESATVDEIRPSDETDPAKEFYQSGLSVPVGDVGVFQAVSAETHAFDDRDVEFAELLVAHAARTIDRIQYERALEERQGTLERQNERLERFVDVVSHDLRNPLSVAIAELELARETCDNEHLDAVAHEHDRMTSLIDDLLSLARDGRPVQDREPVAIEALANSCWTHVETPTATLVVDATLTVDADRGRLQQLFENLFRNSVEHSSTSSQTQSGNSVEHSSTSSQTQSENSVEHGSTEVTVTVGDLPDDRGFFVADDGPGIPAADRDTVFERGYSTQTSGTGFGLAIAREIVEAHDWDITVTESDAGGARFEIRVA
ncbi:sensor histidine kinase [Halorubellus salinus]|uniref:sensor histidine kinase n=1 Tax=Halorubellus salinus TaxID=755309 RepID=UPI001D098CAF|nr:GAF domain-containing sensor histidine kinase [Halorubellus salinus]